MMDLEEIKKQILSQASGIELNLERSRWLSLLKKSLNSQNQIKN